LPGGGGSFRGGCGDGDPLAAVGASARPGGGQEQGGDKRSGRIEAHADFLLALVEGEGDPTLAEMQVRLAERGTPVGIGTLHRFFARHGITRKKRRATPASRTARTS
jgi:transposase